MDPITALALGGAVKGVTDSVSAITKDIQGVAADSFDSIMRSILPDSSATSVNEEELFAALIGQRLGAYAGADAQSAYQSLLAEKQSTLARADGYIPVEDAANEALSTLVANGSVSAEIANKVKNESFIAAQLDDNTQALYDGRGGANDPTIAVMNMEAALIQAQQVIQQLESGELESEDATIAEDTDSTNEDFAGDETITPNGTEVDGAKSGFVFKPESDHGKDLVILLPSQMAETVQQVVLKDEDGNTLESGVSSGYANADSYGEREHFRFSKPGSAYPKNIRVEVTLIDGSIKEYEIPDPAQRYD